MIFIPPGNRIIYLKKLQSLNTHIFDPTLQLSLLPIILSSQFHHYPSYICTGQELICVCLSSMLPMSSMLCQRKSECLNLPPFHISDYVLIGPICYYMENETLKSKNRYPVITFTYKGRFNVCAYVYTMTLSGKLSIGIVVYTPIFNYSVTQPVTFTCLIDITFVKCLKRSYYVIVSI